MRLESAKWIDLKFHVLNSKRCSRYRWPRPTAKTIDCLSTEPREKQICLPPRVFISNRLRCIPSVSTLYAKQRFIFFLTKYWGGDNRWADRSFSDKNTSAIITHLPHTYTLKTIYVLYLRFWFLIAQIKTIPFWQICFYDVLAVQFFEFVFDQFDCWRFTVFYTIKIDFRKRNTKMCKLQKFHNNQKSFDFFSASYFCEKYLCQLQNKRHRPKTVHCNYILYMHFFPFLFSSHFLFALLFSIERKYFEEKK